MRCKNCCRKMIAGVDFFNYSLCAPCWHTGNSNKKHENIENEEQKVQYVSPVSNKKLT